MSFADDYWPSPHRRRWWKELVIYQIYPRSFGDANGDGIGDLRGIIEKLDYIASLGVDMVWLSPIYMSPNDDNGYDVSDYRAIHPEFGTMADFEEMLAAMHRRGLKLMMDVVVNHSSDEHEWFLQSRSSRANPYRDFYHWWPAEKGEPAFRHSEFDEDGSAWAYDEHTDAYYLHYFSRKQPDLNWENPRVRREVYDMMNFWAAKGVDGFRLDAFQFVSKDPGFPPLPEGYHSVPGGISRHHGMGARLHEYLREMNREVLSKYNMVAVAEGAGSSFEDAHAIVDEDRGELHIAYHFEGGYVGHSLERFRLPELKNVFGRWDRAFAEKGWLAIYLANHDLPRMVSKYGNDAGEFRENCSKMLNTFILSMRGTPFCYQGDELGMTNADFRDIEDYNDIAARNGYKKALKEGGDMQRWLESLSFLSRDNARTPMQWNDTAAAGFTVAEPWLRVNPNCRSINVAVQETDPDSPLNYFRRMLQLRKGNPVLVYGDYQCHWPEHEQVFGYVRSLGAERVLVLLNFSDTDTDLGLQPEGLQPREVMISNYPAELPKFGAIRLRPWQALIYRL